jgi:imidazolonepropionase-like amidohydrolase
MPAASIYFSNARLLDGSGRSVPPEPCALLVEGQRITAVAPQSQLPAPPGALLFDLQGMTLMPGLVDCHDHLADLEGGMQARAAIPPTLAVFKAAEAFQQTLLGGFTAIRDASGVDLGMKLAVEQGLIPGPRLKISIVIMSQLGGHNDHTEPAGINSRFPWIPTIPSGICDGPEECRRKVRELVRLGADWIKIATTGGIGSPVGGPLRRQFSPEEVRMIVDTAHAAGLPVGSHAYGGEGVKICLDAGVDSIEHGAALDEPLIEQMARQGTWLVPTFSVLRRVTALGRQDPSRFPDYMLRKAGQLLEVQAASFRKALSAGLRIALGTDLGSFGHGQNAGELAYLVEAGMSPMQAIVAATRMGAECMHLGDEIGMLSAGRLADLLVVDGDPLQDISLLQDRARLRLIMKDGILLKNTLAAPEANIGAAVQFSRRLT